MFIKFVDASTLVKYGTLLCELLEDIIQDKGVKYVVQVIIDNATNYVAFIKLLMDNQPTLLWIPCASHCIDLMLEDIGKLLY
jgi:hypothetical protein